LREGLVDAGELAASGVSLHTHWGRQGTQERSAGLKEQILEKGEALPYHHLSVLKWIRNVQSLVMELNSW